jgi:hypothetical protein
VASIKPKLHSMKLNLLDWAVIAVYAVTLIQIMTKRIILILVGAILDLQPTSASSAQVQPGEMAGYLLVPNNKVPETYDAEREDLQKRVVQLHQRWTKDREYLEPPRIGKLAHLDPALIVTPPKGLEAGYVSIATRQGVEK